MNLKVFYCKKLKELGFKDKEVNAYFNGNYDNQRDFEKAWDCSTMRTDDGEFLDNANLFFLEYKTNFATQFDFSEYDDEKVSYIIEVEILQNLLEFNETDGGGFYFGHAQNVVGGFFKIAVQYVGEEDLLRTQKEILCAEQCMLEYEELREALEKIYEKF